MKAKFNKRVNDFFQKLIVNKIQDLSAIKALQGSNKFGYLSYL